MVLTTVARSTVTATSLADPAVAVGEEKVKSRQTVRVSSATYFIGGLLIKGGLKSTLQRNCEVISGPILIHFSGRILTKTTPRRSTAAENPG